MDGKGIGAESCHAHKFGAVIEALAARRRMAPRLDESLTIVP